MENNTELDNTWKREQNTAKYRSEENEQNKKSLDANRLKKNEWKVPVVNITIKYKQTNK